MLRPEEAYYVPNLTRAMLHGEEPRILVVTVLCVSLVLPLARCRFEGGAIKWLPFEVLASSPERLAEKLDFIKSVQPDKSA